MLGASPPVGLFSLLVARPYSSLDVALEHTGTNNPEPAGCSSVIGEACISTCFLILCWPVVVI